MKIDFKKLTKEPKNFSFEAFGCKLEGKVWKIDFSLYGLEALLSGTVELICDRSGEAFSRELREEFALRISDGIYTPREDDEEFDVIEFFDGFIDMESLLEGELESIRLGYHTKDDSQED